MYDNFYLKHKYILHYVHILMNNLYCTLLIFDNIYILYYINAYEALCKYIFLHVHMEDYNNDYNFLYFYWNNNNFLDINDFHHKDVYHHVHKLNYIIYYNLFLLIWITDIHYYKDVDDFYYIYILLYVHMEGNIYYH